MPRFSEKDQRMMQRALELAALGKGYVSPNPLVGCVIVSKQGHIVGEGYHERYGQAHAEVNAVQSVADKSDLVDATVYVTLEPCSHHGKTPPCATMLAGLPLKRVVIAMVDPNPKVDGKGIGRLRDAGIKVDIGLMEKEAVRLNEFFLHHTRLAKPFVTLKMAQTLDGYIATANGDSQWITGKPARKLVHQWRSEYDAVMVGRNTALADNPRLTVRYVEGRQPKRIVIDGDLTLPRHLNLFSDQYEDRTIVITHNKDAEKAADDDILKLLTPEYFRGTQLVVPEQDGHSDLASAFRKLAEMDIASVLVEAGGNLAQALIGENLVDKIHMFTAPKILGGGIRSISKLGIQSMSEALQLRNVAWEPVGNDMLLTGYF